MGDLRDQLKKAKILSDKKARQLAHQERVHRKQVGREGVEREQSARREELQGLQAREREEQREAQADVEAQRRAAAERAACLDILAHDAIRPRRQGGQRWYFELPDGTLPWLEVDSSLGFQLQSGAYWVMRLGPPDAHVYGLLPADVARRVHAAVPEAAAWAPGGLPRG